MKNKNLFIGILVFAIGLNLLNLNYDDLFDLRQNGVSLGFIALSFILLIFYLTKKSE